MEKPKLKNNKKIKEQGEEASMEHKLQQVFLTHMVKARLAATVFLMNGVKLQGRIESYDEASILLEHKDHRQMIFKHAISTIMPAASIAAYDDLAKQTTLEGAAAEKPDRPLRRYAQGAAHAGRAGGGDRRIGAGD